MKIFYAKIFFLFGKATIFATLLKAKTFINKGFKSHQKIL
jgi:hypothetical protein